MPFIITPASTIGPSAITLTMPKTGYTAKATLTDACGHPIKGASLTVKGLKATPHFPGNFSGTAYVQWTIARNQSAAIKTNLSLAAKEVIHHPSTCANGSALQPVSPHGTGFPVLPVGGGLLACGVIAVGLKTTVFRSQKGMHR